MAKRQSSKMHIINRLLSAPVSALAILLVYTLQVPNPMMLLILPVVYFTCADGYIGGALSGVLVVAYSLYFFSEPGVFFAYKDWDIVKILTIILVLAVIVVLVGRLKRRDKKNEMGTRKLSEDFLNVLSGIDLQLMVTDPLDGTILFTNSKMNRSYGVDFNPVGKPCWQIYQRKESRCDFCPLHKLFADPDTPVVWEYHYEQSDRWYLNRDSFIPWTDGRMVHLQQGMDVTDSHRIQEALQARLRQQELMSAMSSSFISDQDTKLLIENALRTTGEFLETDRVTLRCYEPDSCSARFMAAWCRTPAYTQPLTPAAGPLAALYDIFTREDRPYLACTNTASDPRFAPMAKNGTLSLIAAPVTVDGKLWGILCLEMCSRLRIAGQSDLDIGQMVANLISGVLLRERTQDKLRVAIERAEESARAKTNFLANMSHEIRTPMNAVIGMAELARSSDDPARMRYCLDKVDDASRHLLGVINDILDMSKIDAGRMELSHVDFPLEKMLQRVSTITAFQAEQKMQDFLIRVDPDTPAAIVTDKQRLAQVLTNLLSNAVKFAPEGGRVQLSVRSLGEKDGICTLQFEVEDNGIGISEEHQAKLFQSFQQADNTISRRFGGTGLGLAISKNIIDLMGGEIHVESQLGKGSRFWFIVPVPIGTASPASSLGEDVDWSQVRVMVVDDDPSLLEYASDVIGKAGLHCAVAEGAESAMTLLETEPPYQLMLVDWRMPGTDGIELTQMIREKYGRQIIIVLISAAESKEMAEQAQAAGVDEILVKPLLPSHIIDCLNKCLAGEQALRRVTDTSDNLALHGESRHDGIFEGRRVLVAEDVDINWEIVAAMLADTGIQLENAGDGLQAVELVRADPGRYELILMDIHMPHMDGYQAAKTIRSIEDERARRIPIIAMTANVFKEDVDRCLRSGMNDHMGKPIDSKELVAKLCRFLR
ncbi:response regulator [Ruminococcaceae bacterium OttesenSCG-928-L11]|nr:response regulator [Ruminococcaceae bacterium OttesenSCG-928-L11]